MMKYIIVVVLGIFTQILHSGPLDPRKHHHPTHEQQNTDPLKGDSENNPSTGDTENEGTNS